MNYIFKLHNDNIYYIRRGSTPLLELTLMPFSIIWTSSTPHIQTPQRCTFLGRCKLSPPLHLEQFKHCLTLVYAIILYFDKTNIHESAWSNTLSRLSSEFQSSQDRSSVLGSISRSCAGRALVEGIADVLVPHCRSPLALQNYIHQV